MPRTRWKYSHGDLICNIPGLRIGQICLMHPATVSVVRGLLGSYWLDWSSSPIANPPIFRSAGRPENAG